MKFHHLSPSPRARLAQSPPRLGQVGPRLRQGLKYHSSLQCGMLKWDVAEGQGWGCDLHKHEWWPGPTDSSTSEMPVLGYSYREGVGPGSSIPRRPGEFPGEGAGSHPRFCSLPGQSRAGFRGKGQSLNPQGWDLHYLTPLLCQDGLDWWFQDKGWSNILTSPFPRRPG